MFIADYVFRPKKLSPPHLLAHRGRNPVGELAPIEINSQAAPIEFQQHVFSTSQQTCHARHVLIQAGIRRDHQVSKAPRTMYSNVESSIGASLACQTDPNAAVLNPKGTS